MPLPWPLLPIALLAFLVEAVTGFGATVVILSLGSAFLPIDELLPAWVLANLGLSVAVVWRGRTFVDRPLLFRSVLPWMALGFPLGALLSEVALARSGFLPGLFGLFVVAVGLHELRRGAPGDAAALPTSLRRTLLTLAGVIHGLWGTGGPLVVWALGRQGLDKHRFRATMSALWLCLATLQIASFACAGRLAGATPHRALALLAPVLGGLLLGERVHRAVDPLRFRALVAFLLAASGASLCYRSWTG
jgi:uncharacterized membrane protein YfcA